jgi:hypothetical protein
VSSLSDLFQRHFAIFWALTAFVWIKGGTQYRKKDTFTAISWLVIGLIIAVIDVIQGAIQKQWEGVLLGIIVFSLLSARVHTICHILSDNAIYRHVY